MEILRTQTLADGVENRLLEYIQNSKLQPGDLMPKEEELAQQLNVSRHIVREGVSRLKSLGLVESRKRKGMIVSRPNAFAGVTKLAEANLFSKAERRELMGLRVIMELGMADYIYARKTPELIAELKKAAREPDAENPGPDEVAFHSTLFAIGGNELASRFCEILVKLFDYPLKPSKVEVAPPTHMNICNALEKGSLEEFRETMKSHFAPYKW